MHELSVLVEVVRTVEEVCKEQEIDCVKTIVIEVGDLSSIVPSFMEDYYDTVILDKKIFEKSNLQIDIIKGMGRCSECEEVFNVIETKGYCPKCGSFDKEILCGLEMNIKEILVYDEE